MFFSKLFSIDARPAGVKSLVHVDSPDLLTFTVLPKATYTFHTHYMNEFTIAS